MRTDTCVVLHLQPPTSLNLPQHVFTVLVPLAAPTRCELWKSCRRHRHVSGLLNGETKTTWPLCTAPCIPRLYTSTPLAFFVICMILLVHFKGTKRSLCFLLCTFRLHFRRIHVAFYVICVYNGK